jgi:hypothetical protein
MNYELLTAQLNNGVTVLAKRTKYGIFPMTFANRTQAERRVDMLRDMGIAAGTIKFLTSRPFYVRIGERD